MSNKETTQGRRIYEGFPNNPGEYAKAENGDWILCLPTGIHGTINDKTWKITEHEDGTITVSPSIYTKSPNHPQYDWHGFLEKGIWREC